MPKLISLCDFTGNWSAPYLEAGWEVIRVDIKTVGDVRLMPWPEHCDGILAAPPCTMFAASGARWKRTEAQMLEALSVVDACLRLVATCKPFFWALENPVGTLRRWIGPPAMYFNPCDYGDPYTKKTALWGSFVPPTKTPVPPTLGSKMHRLPPGPDRQAQRSETPAGFARAFYEANH